MNRIRSIAAFAVLSGGLWGAGTPAAMDNPCRRDILKFCKGVEPGQGRILDCLRRHQDELSESCKEAGRRIKAKIESIRNACKEDAQRFCKDVEPGEGRIARCLRGHKDQVSEGCKQAVRQARPAQRTRARKGQDSDGQDKDD